MSEKARKWFEDNGFSKETIDEHCRRIKVAIGLSDLPTSLQIQIHEERLGKRR